MAARKRYIAGKNIKFNGIVLEGQKFILIGKCDSRGQTSIGKKKLLKRDLTHVMLRIEDKKWMKENKLSGFYQQPMLESSFKKFFTLAE